MVDLYWLLRNGLKIQWGLSETVSNGYKRITFSTEGCLSFSSGSSYAVFVTSNKQNDSNATTTNTAYSKNATYFDVKNYRSTASAQVLDNVIFNWFAIGY